MIPANSTSLLIGRLNNVTLLSCTKMALSTSPANAQKRWENASGKRDKRFISLLIKSRDRRCVSEPSKLSYVYGGSTVPLMHCTVGQRLRAAVDNCPDRDLVVFCEGNVRKTYLELFNDARQLAASLISLGVKKGDRVGIWGPNYYEWACAQYATSMAGMILVNINPAYKSEELRFALYKVGVKAVVTPKAFKTSNYKRTLYEVIPSMLSSPPGVGTISSRDLPELEHVILFGQPDKQYKGFWRYEELLKAPTEADFRQLDEDEQKVRFDDPVNIQYTSGTTGYPKAATLTHHNIVNNSYFIGKRLNFDRQREVLCLPTPLYHTFGCSMGLLNAVNHRQTAVFPSPSFNAEAVLKAVSAEKCTLLYGTPTMFIDILNRPELGCTDMSSLHGGIIAGAPCPTTLCERLMSELKMTDFVVCYGSTELSPVVTMSYMSESPKERCSSVGHVMDHTEVAVFDQDGMLVKRGEPGEVCSRGYSVMRGYYNEEAKTREAITPDGWYHTGDTGYMNPDGSLVISGRSKDMIIRGGENIYPSEIEQFLFKMPEIADVHVVGVPDERYGEEICAWVRLRDGSQLTAEELIAHCKGKISHNKVPKYVLFKEEKDFPLTATGKVKRYEIRIISRKELGLEQVDSHFND